jgi:hypothetical protein
MGAMRSNWLDLRGCVVAFAGFSVFGTWYGMAGGDDRITAALFLAAFATMIVGTLWNSFLFAAGTATRRAQRWESEGRCTQCGYDLQGNQTGTCPECGQRAW